MSDASFEKKWWWVVLNSPLFVSVLAASLLAFVGWLYSSVWVPHTESAARFARLIEELEFRVALAQEHAEATNAISVLNAENPSQFAYMEFQRRPLYALLLEMESIGWSGESGTKAALKQMVVSIDETSLPEVYRLLGEVVTHQKPPDDPQYKAVLEEWAGRN
jgi:hypothetical protein